MENEKRSLSDRLKIADDLLDISRKDARIFPPPALEISLKRVVDYVANNYICNGIKGNYYKGPAKARTF